MSKITGIDLQGMEPADVEVRQYGEPPWFVVIAIGPVKVYINADNLDVLDALEQAIGEARLMLTPLTAIYTPVEVSL